ncbi:MAG: M56 family metallopeptidase, partial [Winogradskyella sp.]
MDTYVFKFSACLLVFWLVYVFILERQKMHHIKRFYLLGAFVVSLIIPLLTLTQYVEPVVTDIEITAFFLPLEPAYIDVAQIEPSFWNLTNVLWLVYGLGALLFATRFLVNLINMYLRISKNETISKGAFIYVLLQDYRIPHSFFKYLFFNKGVYESNGIPKEVQLHEETHATQLHSLDILMIEVLQIVFWFHPLVYIFKHHIKLNHEFLADQAVLGKGIDTKTYQNILLQFSSASQDYQFSSAINYSSIKKRFTVMKTHTSKTRVWASSLLLLPIIAILFYSFAERTYVEKETTETSEVLQDKKQSTNEGASTAMMLEYKTWMQKLNNKSSNFVIPVGTWERLAAIYDLMSEEQRNSVKTHPLLKEITPDLYLAKPNLPTAAQFESWKNEKEFAIWLDRKHISNSELNNYKTNDIAHFVGSKAHSNARNKKFPQPFQFNLYTKNGFNKFYTEAYVSDYKDICNEYSAAIQVYLTGSQTDNSELRILKAQADKLYGQFTDSEKTKYKLLPSPPVPAQKQQNATPKQIAAYNAWAKKINTAMAKAKATNDANWHPIVKLKDVNRYKAIYNAMTASQIENAEAWPSFPPPPEMPNKTKQQNKKTIKPVEIVIDKSDNLSLNGKSKKQLDSRKVILKATETLNTQAIYHIEGQPVSLEKAYEFVNINPEAFVKTSQNSDGGLTLSFSNSGSKKMTAEDLQTEYSKIFNAPNSRSTSPMIEFTPLKTKENTNPSFLEFIIDMEQKGATFFMDDKKITAEEAKTIAKSNKGKSTDMVSQLDANGKFIVKLSNQKSKKKQQSKLPMVNGKTITSGTISLSISEIKKLTLTIPNSEITGFNLKIPGVKTEQIKGNTITNTTLKNLMSAKTGDMVMLFDIKDTNDSKFAPIAITIEQTNAPSNKSLKNKEKGGPNANSYDTNLYNADLKKEYITKYKQYETLRYAKPHFIKKSKTDKRLMSDLWVELRQMYFFTLSNDEKKSFKITY